MWKKRRSSAKPQTQVFYDEANVWHFCAREEDRSCADQYSLPATLRCGWNPIGSLDHLQNVENGRYASDHCASPLTSSGSLCHCPLHQGGVPSVMLGDRWG